MNRTVAISPTARENARRWVEKPVLLAVIVTVLALLAAGCGGANSSSGVASIASATTSTTTTTDQSGLVAFSQCMRSNGLSSFPDPQRFADDSVKLTIHQLGNSPQLRTALTACNHLLPSRGGSGQGSGLSRTQLADALSFARCMRGHGVSRFPDPTVQGGLTVEMVQAQGIDVHSPVVLRVVQTCLPASHGALSAAKIRAALAHAGH